MPFQQVDRIRYFAFDSLQARHALFTRRGGLSPAPWESLNVGGTVGDDSPRVRANRNLSLQALGRDPASVFDVWQVHGVDVACADAPRPDGEPVRQADIILTDRPEVTLYMRFADCVPILAHDPRRGVVGIAHAGWLGTLRDAAGSLIAAMHARYGCDPADVRVGIGPSIGPDHYEIGPDVIAQVQEKLGPAAAQVLETRARKTYFDLWQTNRLLLERAGVEAIETAGLCTACHTEDWFSHRAEKGRTGRFGALIALP